MDFLFPLETERLDGNFRSGCKDAPKFLPKSGQNARWINICEVEEKQRERERKKHEKPAMSRVTSVACLWVGKISSKHKSNEMKSTFRMLLREKLLIS